MKPLAALLLLVLVRGVAPQGGVTVCDETGNQTCASQSRLCLNESGNQTCGNCLYGFIEFERANTSCFSIENITFDLFNSSFIARYRDGDTTPILERLDKLKLRAVVVSEWQAQFPYPPFDLAINHLSADADADALSRRGYNASLEPGDAVFPRFAAATRRRAQTQTSLPPAVDWNAAGGVTSVKNQESCGCCWACSVVGAVEGASFITNGFIESLSFQQLISCVTMNNLGCNGGSITSALDYTVVNKFGGVTDDSSYPFVDQGGTTTTTCSLSSKPLVVTPNGPRTVLALNDDLSFDERVTRMKMAVVRQPVSVTMSANCDTFQSYRQGVMTTDGSCMCQTPTCLDHAILMVGYNDSAATPYWLLKSSWGTGWGESGFFRVSQAQNGEKWGLFGLMGQAILPIQAYNDTAIDPADLATSAGDILGLWIGSVLVLIGAVGAWIA